MMGVYKSKPIREALLKYSKFLWDFLQCYWGLKAYYSK